MTADSGYGIASNFELNSHAITGCVNDIVSVGRVLIGTVLADTIADLQADPGAGTDSVADVRVANRELLTRRDRLAAAHLHVSELASVLLALALNFVVSVFVTVI
jgi:hypothetical protein